jgi:hypothetical protein
MSMVAAVTLFAVATFKEIAHLGLVDTSSHSKVTFAMGVKAVFVIAAALQECLAKLCLLQVGSYPEFIW